MMELESTEQAYLIREAQAALKDNEADTVTKIKTVTWRLGLIVEVAKKQGYTKIPGGLKSWAKLHNLKSHTHLYRCLKCWKTRNEFDAALKHYRERNDAWEPKHTSGPLFQLELIAAYKNRGQPAKARNVLRKPINEKRIKQLEAYIERLQDQIIDLERRLNSTNRPAFKRALQCLECVAVSTDDEKGHSVCVLCDHDISDTTFEDHYKTVHLDGCEPDDRYRKLMDDVQQEADREQDGESFCALCDEKYEGSWYDHFDGVHDEPDIVETK